MEKFFNQKESGQSLVEMVVAVGIAAMVIVALLIGAVVSIRNVQFSRNQSRAMELNREVSEWLRSQEKTSWSQLWSNGSELGEPYCFWHFNFDLNICSDDDNLIDDKFIRQGVLQQDGRDKLEITITTSWNDTFGDHDETITTYLTKY